MAQVSESGIWHKGFKESGIYPISLDTIKKGKLTPLEVYKRPEPLPEIADKSVIINEDGDREVANQDLSLRPSTLMANLNDDTPLISTQETRNMIITIGNKKFECVPIDSVNEEMEKSKEAKLDKIFGVLQVQQKAKRGPVQTQGLPKLLQGISDERYIKMLKEKEGKKKKEVEKKKRKKEHEEKAERKWIEKEQKAALKEAKKSVPKGC